MIQSPRVRLIGCMPGLGVSFTKGELTMSLADQMMSGMPDLDRLQSFGRGCANAAVDPECIARQQEAVWRDHLARVAWLRSMAIHDIRRQPFFR